MEGLNEITQNDIEQLNAEQLSSLLKDLLVSEAQANNIIHPIIDVPDEKINVSDGGEDGRIKWVGQIPRTVYLLKRFCLFQCKATDLSPGEAYDEIIIAAEKKKGNIVLKTQVNEVVSKDGVYILFINKNLNNSLQNVRIDKFHDAIIDSGNSNYLKSNILVYNSEKIRDWTNNYIRSVKLVQNFVGKSRNINLLTSDEWRVIEQRSLKYDFCVNDEIEKIKGKILALIQSNKTIRVYGLSGLGKTRIVYEALVNGLSQQAKALSKNLLYYNVGDHIGAEEVIKSFFLSNKTKNGLLILDNCPLDFYEEIIQYSNFTSISVIAIDASRLKSNTNEIEITPNLQLETVKQIIKTRLQGNHSNVIDFVIKSCEGYPQLAHLFCDSIISQGEIDVESVLPENLLEKLILEKDSNDKEIELELLKACSLFSSFGFLRNEDREHLNEIERETLIEETSFILEEILEKKYSNKDFYKLYLKKVDKGIFEVKGGQLTIRPPLLAIYLAVKWWKETPTHEVVELLKKLNQSKLGINLCTRLKDLDQLPEAKGLVNEVWGDKSPFTTAEVLNTNLGSLLFRHIAEVNPDSAMKSLWKVFNGMSKESITDFKEGRRNIVWTLEKLAFRKETFVEASLILLKLAISENEEIGNNATGQFSQLFNIHLAGTEASLKLREEVVDHLFTLPESNNDLKVKVIATCLNTHGFSRISGAERLGTKTLIDFRPSLEEINEYFTSNLARIEGSIKNNDSLSAKLLKVLGEKLRGLIGFGCLEQVSDIIKLSDIKGSNLVDIINSLKKTVQYEKLSDSEKKIILGLINEIAPKDLKGKLISIVVKPEWVGTEKDDNGHYIDQPKITAEQFASEVRSNIDELYANIEVLIKGEQRQAFNFGQALVKAVPNPETLLLKTLKVFKTIPKEEVNADFIGGLFAGMSDRKLKNKYLDLIAADEQIQHLTFYFTKVSNYSVDDFNRLFNLVDNGLDVTS